MVMKGGGTRQNLTATRNPISKVFQLQTLQRKCWQSSLVWLDHANSWMIVNFLLCLRIAFIFLFFFSFTYPFLVWRTISNLLLGLRSLTEFARRCKISRFRRGFMSSAPCFICGLELVFLYCFVPRFIKRPLRFPLITRCLANHARLC